MSQLCRFAACEQHQVVGDDRRPDVGLKMVEPAPSAAPGAIDAFETGDAGLDAGAKVAQPAIDAGALDHIGDGDAALLMKGDILLKGDILHTARLGLLEV